MAQFERLIEIGAFVRGMNLTIHAYSEHYSTR
jgi:hypothetical protein